MSFTKNVVTGTSADGEYVYYNATVVNNTVSTTLTTDDPNVYFQDTRIVPIVKDTSKYVVSVDNFTINGGSKNLPLFIPQIVVGSDINLTIYTVTFGCRCSAATGTGTGTGGTWIQATIPITWIPENQAEFTVVPTTATPRQAETDYYYCYSYDHWVNLMNNAITAAWRDVKKKASALSLTMATVCPYFTFNQTTGLFSLHQDAQSSWLPFGTAPRASNQVSDGAIGVSDAMAPYTPFDASTASGYSQGEYSYVGWNTNLDLLIANMDTIYFGGDTTPVVGGSAGYDYEQTTSTVLDPDTVSPLFTGPTQLYYPENIVNVIPVQDQFGSNVFTLTSPYANPTTAAAPVYISQTQDFISTGSIWSPIASIVLV